jgi:preprotein translocase subunit YajC
VREVPSEGIDVYYAASGAGSALPQILLIVLFIGLFYFLLLRPMRRRQAQAAEAANKMRNDLSPGDEIVTVGGLMAKVVSTDEESVTLELSPGITARYDLKAIARIVPPKEPQTATPASSETDTTANSVVEERD